MNKHAIILTNKEAKILGEQLHHLYHFYCTINLHGLYEIDELPKKVTANRGFIESTLAKLGSKVTGRKYWRDLS